MNEAQKKELKNDLKQEGLEYAEDVTVETIEHVFNFAKTALSKSGNVMLTALIPILTPIENYLLGLADGIDGQKG